MGGVSLAVAGVGFAFAARDLRQVTTEMGDWVSPATEVRPSRAALVTAVQSLARLETAVVSLEQQVVGQRGSDGSWGWVGERMVFMARGEVTAGVDLALLDASHVVVAPDGTVTLGLPPVEVWRVDLDEEASFVQVRERGWFGVPDPDLESQARREAVRVLRQAALDADVLGTAEAGAEQAIRALLLQTGATRVVFRN